MTDHGITFTLLYIGDFTGEVIRMGEKKFKNEQHAALVRFSSMEDCQRAGKHLLQPVTVVPVSPAAAPSEGVDYKAAWWTLHGYAEGLTLFSGTDFEMVRRVGVRVLKRMDELVPLAEIEALVASEWK